MSALKVFALLLVMAAVVYGQAPASPSQQAGGQASDVQPPPQPEPPVEEEPEEVDDSGFLESSEENCKFG